MNFFYRILIRLPLKKARLIIMRSNYTLYMFSRHRDLDTRSLQSGSTVTSGTMNGSLQGDYGHQRHYGHPTTRKAYSEHFSDLP